MFCMRVSTARTFKIECQPYTEVVSVIAAAVTVFVPVVDVAVEVTTLRFVSSAIV